MIRGDYYIMNEFLVTELVLIAVAGGALVFGVLVFRGDPKWLSMVAGGRNFLSRNPDPATASKVAKMSGVVLCLIAAVVFCAAVWNGAAVLGASQIVISFIILTFATLVVLLVISVVFSLAFQIWTHFQMKS